MLKHREFASRSQGDSDLRQFPQIFYSPHHYAPFLVQNALVPIEIINQGIFSSAVMRSSIFVAWLRQSERTSTVSMAANSASIDQPSSTHSSPAPPPKYWQVQFSSRRTSAVSAPRSTAAADEQICWWVAESRVGAIIGHATSLMKWVSINEPHQKTDRCLYHQLVLILVLLQGGG